VPEAQHAVGVVVKWDYKPIGLDLSPDDASVAIAALDVGGPWREQSRSATWAGLAIAKVMGLNLEAKGVKKQIEGLLAEWVADGSLELSPNFGDGRAGQAAAVLG
jgi:hypothetical protein